MTTGPTPREQYEALLARDVASIPPLHSLALVSTLVNLSTDLDEQGGLHRAIAIAIANDLESRLPSEARRTELLYVVGNAWSALEHLRPPTEASVWDWEQHELRQAILAYRRAVRSPGFSALAPIEQSRLLTNLANLLDRIGRSVDAIETWDRALTITPGFGMARGNRALGLVGYANHLYDDGHRALLLKTAFHELNEALKETLEGNAPAGFTDHRDRIARRLTPEYLARKDDLDRHSLGDAQPEQEYRKTILGLRLFLNPLNDIGRNTIAATDVLGTPPIVVRVGTAPYYQGFLSQLKQEFIAARYLYYKGSRPSATPHYADRDTYLTDTLDYPAYGLRTEQLRASYRLAYSLFDKIAYFLNHYLSLGINEKSVYFRTLWYAQMTPKRVLRPDFLQYENLPLRGLYWLAQDLAPPDDADMETLNPDAQHLATIRNHLEHKFLKLHTEGPFPTPRLDDPLTFSLTRHAFEQKCRRVLRLSRAAIIHLILAVHREERLREEKRPKDMKVAKITLDKFPDHQKR
jgi:tetratricopeptide (TPR) repeat protein